MTAIRKKVQIFLEGFRRETAHRDYERFVRQNRIREQRSQIAKDLMLGHHLGEYKLQQDELELVSSASLDGKKASLIQLIRIHQKYRG
jgi:hypothetical protein